MKKQNISILSLLIFFVLNFQISAQDTRTLKTKVADILAQMPAQSNEHLNKALNQTISLGDEGLSEMIHMLKPAGQGNDVAVRFTLTSLARYTSQKGHEKEWALLQSDFLKAIGNFSDKEIQAYLIHQLNYGGNDQCVENLKSYLSDSRLCEPVTQLFINIKSSSAEKALLDVASSSSGENQITIIKSLGEFKSKAALPILMKLEGNQDHSLQRTVLAALANIGAPESYLVLNNAMQKALYKYEPTEATASFLKYANRLGENKETVLCEQACEAIFKANTESKLLPNRVAAFAVYAKYFKPEAMKMALKEINSENAEYRTAILHTLTGHGDAVYTQKWTKKAKNAPADIKADIIYFLGERADKSATPFVRNQLADNSAQVRNSAIWALVKLNDQEALTDLLNHVSKGNDSEETEKALKTLLNESKLDIVAKFLESAPNAGKPSLINLIASKSGSRYFKTIFAYTSNEDTQIKNAAINALQSISTYTDLGTLLPFLLQTNDPIHIQKIQNAIVKAANDETDKDIATLPILSALKQTNSKEKIIPVLPAIGGKKALKAVTELYESSAGETIQTCFKALVNWNDHTAASALFEICKSDNQDYRNEAFSGYVNQIRRSNMPADQKLLKFQKIMPLAQNDQEKLQVIRSLDNLKTFLTLVYVSKYLDDPALQSDAANAAVQIALPDTDYKTGLYGDIPKTILKKALTLIRGPESDYIKENVNRYIETMPTDQGFVSMFNGIDLSGWKGFITDPIKLAALTSKEIAKLQLIANEKLKENWRVKDGMIFFNGDGANLLSEKDYGDFEMIVNWKISKKGDSGIYLRGSPQVQIWDTTRVEVGAQVGSGGLYNNQVNPSKPLKVADNPIEDWNTFHIKMVGEKVTVFLNGELVVDNVVLENYWDRKQPIFPTGTIELQAHGTDLAFKDIYIREIKSQETVLSPEEKKEGFNLLFNGKNLDGWIGNKTDYKAEDGNIVIQSSNGEGGGNLFTEKEYSDFTFRFEFQLTPGANNGLGIRAPLEGDAAYVGMELQILDNTAAVYADLKPYQYHGSVYGVIPAKRDYLKPIGEWNSEEVTIKGSRIKIVLNGTTIVDGDIKEASKNGTLDGKDHPGLLRDKGHIGFLGHGSLVKFRNIRIKEL